MWPRTTMIGNIAEVKGGKRLPKGKRVQDEATLHPYLRVVDFSEDGLDRSNIKFIDSETHLSVRRYIISENDVYISIAGTIGRVGIVPKEFSGANLTENAAKITGISPEYDKKFLMYFLRSDFGQAVISSKIVGTSQPKLALFRIREIEVPLLERSIQQKIAAILSTYDDQIENNLRRIKILEEMAKNLYREWFVKFRFHGHEQVRMVDSPLGKIPEKWEIKTLGEVAVNFDRLRKPLSKIQRTERQGTYPYYGAAKIFDYINDYIFDGVYLLMAEDGSVVTPDRQPVLQYVTGKFWVNNHAHILQGADNISTEYLCLALSDIDVSGYITGAAQPKITQANLNRIPVIVADDTLLKNFDEIVSGMFRQKVNLLEKNKVLRQTRDLLLPILISGEVDVSELDINIGEAA